jgi:hypothetical protein
MKKTTPRNLSIWQRFLNVIKAIIHIFQPSFTKFSSKYYNLLETIQLTWMYFFAVVDLLYSILTTVFSFGYFPAILEGPYPLIKAILDSPILKAWASPEKVFFLSYVVIEFMVVRSAFNFSKLVKYNILLLFALLMIQGLVISYWDLLFHREIATPVAKWAVDQGGLLFTDETLAILFFFTTFIFFTLTYVFLYVQALQGEYAVFPGTTWLTDSISFWLRIKTPTMPYGTKKK